MRAVNLLPADAVRRKRLRSSDSGPALVGLIGGTIVLLALVAAFVLASRTETSNRELLDQRQSELAVLPLPEKQTEQQAQSPFASEQAPRTTALRTALDGRVRWDRIMERVSLVLPQDVWLRTLDLRSPAIAARSAGASSSSQGLSAVGYTYSHRSVARLLSRLALVPELANVQLQSSAVSELGGRKVVEFTIVAGVQPEGPTS